MCKALLYDFLQDLREASRMPYHKGPLRKWEAKQAWRLKDEGKVGSLVKFLALTEDHIRYGERRRLMQEGHFIGGPDAAKMLFLERQDVAAQLGHRGRHPSQDEFVRAFLDGQLSWRRARDILQAAREVPRGRPP